MAYSTSGYVSHMWPAPSTNPPNVSTIWQCIAEVERFIDLARSIFTDSAYWHSSLSRVL